MFVDQPFTVVFLDNMCPQYPVLSYKAITVRLLFTTVCSYKITFSAFFAVSYNEIQIQSKTEHMPIKVSRILFHHTL